MVTAMYRVRALDVHPDKNNNDTSNHMMVALTKARDYLLKYIASTHSRSSASSQEGH